MSHLLLKSAKLLAKARFASTKTPCSMVVLAAGSSQRMGADKLIADIGGKPALAWTLLEMQKCGDVNEIVVVTRADRLGEIADLCKRYGVSKVSKVVSGGETRMQSAWLGISAVSRRAKLTGIHDGARPMITSELVSGVISLAQKTGAAVAAVREADTVKRSEAGVLTQSLEREGLVRIQTPQVFDSELIRAATFAAIERGDELTDDSAAVQALGAKVHIAEGSMKNIKLTTAEDLDIARALFAAEAKKC